MSSFLKILLTAIFGALWDVIKDKFKKSPEEKAKEKYDEKINQTIDRIESDDPGYRLPVGTADKWGETIATETRLESGADNGTKRPAG